MFMEDNNNNDMISKSTNVLIILVWHTVSELLTVTKLKKRLSLAKKQVQNNQSSKQKRNID